MIIYARNLMVLLAIAGIIYLLVRRRRERQRFRLGRKEALALWEPAQELAETLDAFRNADNLRIAIRDAPEEQLPRLLNVSYPALGREADPILIDGEYDREDWIDMLSRKEKRLLISPLPRLLNEIFENSWDLRQQNGDSVSKTDRERDIPSEEEESEESKTVDVPCCICGRPAKWIAFRYRSSDYIPPDIGGEFQSRDISSVMKSPHAWFLACSVDHRKIRLLQAEEAGEVGKEDEVQFTRVRWDD